MSDIKLPRSEWQFRELVGAMRVGNPLRSMETKVRRYPGGGVDSYIKVIKDITEQSFGGENLFEQPGINNHRNATTVRFKFGGVRNQLSASEVHRTGWKILYPEMMDCITIPLVRPKGKLFWAARLVIACHQHLRPQISVQLLQTAGESHWVTIPCNTGNVRKTINEMVLGLKE